ncbi:Predicted arabinose efflux permease, MFS family [Sphingobium sp. AP50]|nr:Predicted arabinose efflux permease, MFS family [Sphingobium sp. AP50]
MDIVPTNSTAVAKPVSWIAIGSLAIGAFALVTSEFLPVGLLPQIATDVGVTTGEAGLMVTMPGFLAAIAAILTIQFAGHVDRRRVLTILLGLLVASNLVVATAASFPQLLVGRMLLGIAVGSFWTIAGSLGPRLKPGPDGIRASALILSGVSIGTVAGVPAGALIGDLFGWRVAFGAGAGLAGMAIVALVSLLPAIPAERSNGLSEIPSILREPRARLGLLGAISIFVGQFAAYTYVAPFLDIKAGIAGGTLSMLLLANGAAGFFGNITGGWLSSKDLKASVVLTGLVLGGSVLLLSMFGTHPSIAALLVVAWGFGFGMMPISLQSWMFSAAPGRLEGMQALFVSVAQAALGSGALIGGLIVDHVGITGALVFGSLAALCTAMLLGIFGRAAKPGAAVQGLCDHPA